MYKPAAAVIFGALLFSSPASANLIGSTISGSLSKIALTPLTIAAPFNPSAVIGPGTEFTGTVQYQYDAQNLFDWTFNVDFGADNLKIVLASNNPISNISGPPQIFLDFTGFPSTFAGFDTVSYFCDRAIGDVCLSLPPNVVPNSLSSWGYDGSKLSLAFRALYAGDTYVFRQSNSVPEPLSLLIFGSGLTSAITMRRRKKA